MKLFTKSSVVFGSLIASVLAFSCTSDQSDKDSGNAGKVGMAIQLPSNAGVINAVHWAITGNGVNRSGDINTSASRTASAQIGGLVGASGYGLVLTADSTDGTVHCDSGRNATGDLLPISFSVVAGKVTKANVALTCHLPNGTVVNAGTQNGAISFAATVGVDGGSTGDVCPVINSVTISPSEVMVGSSIALDVSATDSDNQPQALTYAWTENGVALPTSGTGASQSYTCTSVGTHVIKLTVSDGFVRDGAKLCDQTFETDPASGNQVIVCTAGPDGSGGAAGSSGTLATGGMPATGGTTATGGAPETGGTTATGGAPETGGTTATGGAATGGAATGGAATGGAATGGAATGGAATGGAATGGAATGGAATGGAATGGAGTGGATVVGLQATITTLRGAACYQCAAQNCNSTEDAVGYDVISPAGTAGSNSCESYTGADRDLCLASLSCILGNNCVARGTVGACFCGTAQGTACSSAPNGACVAQEVAGLKTTNDSTGYGFIISNFGYADMYPGASANSLVQCMFDSGCSTCFQ